MAEKLKELMQQYEKGQITRRDFMRKAAAITGSLAAANTLLDVLMQPISNAAQVDPNDSGIVWHHVEFNGRAGAVFGYLVRPAARGKYPGIIVIHANQGINDHFRDVARRLAKQGYVALVPDYLSRAGGTMKANPQGRGFENIRDVAPWQLVAEDTDSGYAYLRTLPDVRGDRMGLVGFCWGGAMCFTSATQVRGLRATVVFYGRSPNPLELVKNIGADSCALRRAGCGGQQRDSRHCGSDETIRKVLHLQDLSWCRARISQRPRRALPPGGGEGGVGENAGILSKKSQRLSQG